MKYINAIKYKNNREHETGDETGDEIKDNKSNNDKYKMRNKMKSDATMKFEIYEIENDKENSGKI